MLQECTPVYLFLKIGPYHFQPGPFRGKKMGVSGNTSGRSHFYESTKTKSWDYQHVSYLYNNIDNINKTMSIFAPPMAKIMYQ